MFTYKCVHVPQTVKIGRKDTHSKAVKAYEDIINEHAAGGWEYVGIDTIESFFQQGCLESISATIPIIGAFFRGDELVRIKMIVFRRPR